MNNDNRTLEHNIEPDLVRIGVKENAIQLEFMQTSEDYQSPENRKVSYKVNIRMSPKYLQNFALNIIEAGIAYEKTFDADIGFTPFWKADNV